MASKLDPGQRFFISNEVTLPARGMAREWHEEIEFFCVKSGHLTLHIEEVSITLYEGDVVIIPPDLCHWVSRHASSKASYEYILFSSALFSGRGERGYIGPLRLNGRAYILKLSEDGGWKSESLRLIVALKELRASADARSSERATSICRCCAQHFWDRA